MKFEEYLKKSSEVGYVVEVYQSIVNVEGLPNLHYNELVVFENGAVGQAFSLSEDHSEILLIDAHEITVGMKVARTSTYTNIGLSDHLLGSVIDPLGNLVKGNNPEKIEKYDLLDKEPHGILGRKEVTESFHSGVKMVDIVVPLGKGQRELVIGDRKTGKTLFLMQSILNQVKEGSVCVYAGIGKRQQDVKSFIDFVETSGLTDSVVTVISGAAEAPGKIFLTPYTAMTIAEYFRDKGKNVLVVLDDMTAHAKYYREITLEARRFPGRSSYPGDIFYLHAKLLERAGNFDQGAITCLPVAESVLGDLSGYIQTNLMSMTDGHIYFDIDLFNKGQRPAVNPFLSVTRVGHQAQSALMRDISRHISSFLVQLENMQDFMHFGAEIGEQAKETFDLGARVKTLFDQDYRFVVPVNIVVFLLASIWGGLGKEMSVEEVEDIYNKAIKAYAENAEFNKRVDEYILGTSTFKDLIAKVREEAKTLYEG